jgi:hypothetical protein
MTLNSVAGYTDDMLTKVLRQVGPNINYRE